MPDLPSLEDPPFSDDELDLYLTDVDPEGHASRWSVTDHGAAEWAMERLAGALDEIDGLEEQAAVWRSRIDDWLTASAARPRRFAAFLERQLSDYALAQRAANPKAATVSVPSGKVSTRKVEARPVIAAEDAVLEWLDERGDVPEGAIKRSPRVSKLRSVIAIAERETGRFVVEVGCCGASLTLAPDVPLDDTAAATVGLCSNCGAIGPAVLEASPETVLVAVDAATGALVPGVIVEPFHYDVTVKPNRG